MFSSSTGAVPIRQSQMEGDEEEDLRSDHGDKIPQSDNSRDGPSNEFVLNVAFLTFMGFLLIEAVFALIAHSQSMMADAMAMSVDAFTYLFNLMAERLKNKHDNNGSHDSHSTEGMSKDDEMTMRQNILNRKIKKLYLELVPPAISVVALIFVSMYACVGAMDTIVNHKPHPKHKLQGGDGETPDVAVMFIFSAANLLLDLINVAFFAKLKHFVNALSNTFMSSNTKNTPQNEDNDPNNNDFQQQETTNLLNNQNNVARYSHDNDNDNDDDNIPCEINLESIQRINHHHQQQQTEKEDKCSDETEDSGKVLNLNMCSAYTHIMADTMRSITVLIVAAMAYCVESVDNDLADASGAIIVSIIIAISLGPLLVGIFTTWSELNVYVKMRQQLLSTANTKSITISSSDTELSTSQS